MAEGLHRDIFNQCALRRLDPNLREVVGFSAFVAIYKFSPGENQWKKSDVEGTLFVYARSGQPSHNILVLNRLNPNNFVEPISGQLILQRREPFLFYVTPTCSLYGIWFHDRGDCLRVTYILEGIVRQLTVTPVADEEWSDIPAFKSLMGMTDTPRNSAKTGSRGKKSGTSNGRTAAQPKKSEAGKTRIAAQLSRTGDGNPRTSAQPNRATNGNPGTSAQPSRATTGNPGTSAQPSRATTGNPGTSAQTSRATNGNPGTSTRAKKRENVEVEGAVAARGVEDITDEDEDKTPKSVVDFFARAGCAPINTQVGLMPGMTHMYGDDSEGAAMNPIVHQIVTNPYHSLEHVEKQQMMASSQEPAGTSTQKTKSASNQKPKTAKTQRPKAATSQKPKTGSTQKPKEDRSQKTKEGEKKSPKPEPPGSLVEFLNRLKISRSTNPGPEGRIEEIPDLLSMIPEPPIPNIESVPRTFQPIPFLPGHIGPIETFQFIPGPMDAFGFIPAGSRPLPPFPGQDMGFLRFVPPEVEALMAEPPMAGALMAEPPMAGAVRAAPPVAGAVRAAPPVAEAVRAESPVVEAVRAAPPPEISPTAEPPTELSQTSEPPAPLSQTPEPPLPLSPTPEPPVPLSSILRHARRSLPPKPALPKPLSLLPKPPEPSLSSLPKPPEPSLSPMQPPILASKNASTIVKDHDYNGQAAAAAAAGNNAGEDGGDINLHGSKNDGESATAAPNPPPHTQARNYTVETLTRDQLLETIQHLLQNDPTFISKIHEAYLKSLNDKFPQK